jgi:hypothetical protein
MKHRGIIAAAAACTALWAAVAVLAAAAPGVTRFLTLKEGAAEHLTHLVLLAAVLLHTRLWSRDRSRRENLFLALLCTLFFLEETDYLQVYLGFPTPPQVRPWTGTSDSLNFHNTTAAKVAIPVFYIAYFLVLPLLGRFATVREKLARVGLLPLTIPFASLFWLNVACSLLVGIAGRSRVDATELLDLAVAALLLLAALPMGALRR